MALETDLLLERDAELAVLTDEIRRTLAGDGALVVIAGPAGRGKTSLLNETVRTASARGLRTLSGRGSPLEKEFAFGVVRQLFEGLLLRSSEEGRRRWVTGPAEAAGALFGLPGGHTAPDEMALVHSLYWLTAHMSQDRPLLLAVDDLHWADEASLRFLAYLRLRARSVNILVVATTREYASAKGVLGALTHDHDVRVLDPAPLSPAAVKLILQTAIGEVPSPEAVSSCSELTDGNPLLLKEIVRAITEAGMAGRQVTSDTISLLGGQALLVWIAVELRRLSPAARAVAEALSVLGDGAELYELRLLSGLAEAEVWACLEELERLELLHPAEPGDSTVRFLQPLIRDAVYHQLAVPLRFRYHQEAAELMIQQGSDAEESAEHLLSLPSPSREHVQVLVLAAEQSAQRGEPEAAHRYLVHALKADLPAQARLGIVQSAVTMATRFDMAQALKHLKEALRLTDDPATSARLLAAAAWAEVWLGHGHGMAGRLRELADALPDHETDVRCRVEEALLLAGIGSNAFPDYEARIPHLSELTRTATLDAALLQTTIACHEALKGDARGLTRTRLALGHPKMIEAVSAGATVGHNGYLALVLGDLDAGVTALTELIKVGKAGGGANVLALPYLHRALGYLRKGELALAETDLRALFALERRAPMGTVSHLAAGFLVEVLIERGRLEEAEELMERSAPSGSSTPNKLGYSLRQARTRLLMAQGAYGDALDAALAAGRHLQTTIGDNPALVSWRSDAALCLHALGEDERALRLARQELEKSEVWGAPHVVGRSLRVLGRLDASPAGEHRLLRGIDLLRRSGAQLELAKALIDLGSARRRRGHRADARALLGEGLDLVERLDAAGIVEQARSELRAAGGRPTGRRNSPQEIGRDALTPSEERVASLAVEGLTNREIAQRLIVSVKTVEVHLSSVYKKLGLTRRSQLRDMLAGQRTG